jgi:hypothetical protein
MIIVQLKGGFGNQLFQYAAGYSLAKHCAAPLKVDVSEFTVEAGEKDTPRNYELQYLAIPPVIATKQEVDEIKNTSVIQTYFEKLLPSYKRRVYKESRFEFDTNFWQAGTNIYLKGYRQSEKYFAPYTADIKKNFQLQERLTGHLQPLSLALQQKESVSIHIRRGDYLQQHMKDYHGVLGQEYYQTAIDTINSVVPNPSYFIFSDSVEWVKENLKFSGQVEFISGTITKTHYEDFYLMSKCKHNIIANSSFSWWAAWLNSNSTKKVIAPKKWFNKAAINTKDLIPESWVRL